MLARLLLLFISSPLLAQDLPIPNPHQLWYLEQSGVSGQDQITDIRSVPIPASDSSDIDLPGSLNVKKPMSIIAILDQGIDFQHPVFTMNFLPEELDPERRRFCQRQIDRSGEAKCPQKLLHRRMKDFSGSGTTRDNLGHGTKMAGMIALALRHPKLRPAAGHIQVLSIKVMSRAGGINGYAKNIVEGIKYAVQQGADVINMSLGWPNIAEHPDVQSVIEDAYKAGVIFVASAGNASTNDSGRPCSLKHVLCVGASTQSGHLASFSDRGGFVDILAPGHQIMTSIPLVIDQLVRQQSSFGIHARPPQCLTWKRDEPMSPQFSFVDGFDKIYGSSPSAPLVSLAAALTKLSFPDARSDEVLARIFAGARLPLDEGASLKGVLSIAGALSAKPQSVVMPDFKTMDMLRYDSATKSFQIPLNIKNYWAKTEGLVDVRLDVFSQGKVKRSQTWQIDMEAFESRILSTAVRNYLPSDSSVIDLKVSISAGLQTERYSHKVHLFQDVDQAFKWPLSGASADDLLDGGLDENRKLSSIKGARDLWPASGLNPILFTLRGQPLEDQCTAEEVMDPGFPRPNPHLTVFAPQAKGYRKIIDQTIQAEQYNNDFYRLDLDGDDRPDYMFITYHSRPRLSIRHHLYSGDGRPLRGEGNSDFDYLAEFEVFGEGSSQRVSALRADIESQLFGKGYFTWRPSLQEGQLSYLCFSSFSRQAEGQFLTTPERRHPEERGKRFHCLVPDSEDAQYKLRTLNDISFEEDLKEAMNLPETGRVELVLAKPVMAGEDPIGIFELKRHRTDSLPTYVEVRFQGLGQWSLVRQPEMGPLLSGVAIPYHRSKDRAPEDYWLLQQSQDRLQLSFQDSGLSDFKSFLLPDEQDPARGAEGVYRVASSDLFFGYSKNHLVLKNLGVSDSEFHLFPRLRFTLYDKIQTLVYQTVWSQNRLYVIDDASQHFRRMVRAVQLKSDGFYPRVENSFKVPNGCAPLKWSVFDHEKNARISFLCPSSESPDGVEIRSLSIR